MILTVSEDLTEQIKEIPWVRVAQAVRVVDAVQEAEVVAAVKAEVAVEEDDRFRIFYMVLWNLSLMMLRVKHYSP